MLKHEPFLLGRRRARSEVFMFLSAHLLPVVACTFAAVFFGAPDRQTVVMFLACVWVGMPYVPAVLRIWRDLVSQHFRAACFYVDSEEIVRIVPGVQKKRLKWEELVGFSPMHHTLYFEGRACLPLVFVGDKHFDESEYTRLMERAPTARVLGEAIKEYESRVRKALRGVLILVYLLLGAWLLSFGLNYGSEEMRRAGIWLFTGTTFGLLPLLLWIPFVVRWREDLRFRDFTKWHGSRAVSE